MCKMDSRRQQIGRQIEKKSPKKYNNILEEKKKHEQKSKRRKRKILYVYFTHLKIIGL